MEVSPVEQDTIDCEYLAYFEPNKKKIKEQLFGADAEISIRKRKKNILPTKI